ncbi:MAG: hypothetical protein AAF560_11940 [Acidobacteriota bacterium]
MTDRYPLTSLAKLTIFCLLLTAVTTATPASAGNAFWEVAIDCYHSDYDGDAAGDRIEVELYSNGSRVGSESLNTWDESPCAWGSTDPESDHAWIEDGIEVDEIRLYATSTDAWFLDHVNLERDDNSIEQWGVDNGNGWCLSEDTSDGANMPIDQSFGCQPCLRFYRGDNLGYGCPSDFAVRYKLHETPARATRTQRLATRGWPTSDLMTLATDIAGVDHDGDGVDEIAVLINMGTFQYVRLYEADADFTHDAPVGWWTSPFITAFAIAGVDHDGDGVDEIAILKNQGGDRNLYLYDAPIGAAHSRVQVGANTGDLASGLSLQITGIDHDGDGVDEIGVLKQIPHFGDAFYIYDAPIGTQNTPLVGLDFWEIPAYTPWDIAGIDIDGDGIDEVGVLKIETNWNRADYEFVVFEAPIGIQASDKLFADLGANIANGGTAFVVTGVDLDGDGTEEIATLEH